MKLLNSGKYQKEKPEESFFEKWIISEEAQKTCLLEFEKLYLNKNNRVILDLNIILAVVSETPGVRP